MNPDTPAADSLKSWQESCSKNRQQSWLFESFSSFQSSQRIICDSDVLYRTRQQGLTQSFVNSHVLKWFFQEVFFCTVIHSERLFGTSLFDLKLLKKELRRSTGRLYLQCTWKQQEMSHKQMSSSKKQKSYRKLVFIVQYPIELTARFVSWRPAWTCKVFIFVVMETNICFPELLLLFPVLEWFGETNL